MNWCLWGRRHERKSECACTAYDINALYTYTMYIYIYMYKNVHPAHTPTEHAHMKDHINLSFLAHEPEVAVIVDKRITRQVLGTTFTRNIIRSRQGATTTHVHSTIHLNSHVNTRTVFLLLSAPLPHTIARSRRARKRANERDSPLETTSMSFQNVQHHLVRCLEDDQRCKEFLTCITMILED